MNSIDLPYARLRYEFPVVYIQFKDHTEIGYPEVLELVRSAEALSGYKPYVVLADARKTVSVTPEGKKFSLSPSVAPLHYGTAVLVHSKMIEAAATVFIRFAHIPFPYKVFADEEKAVGWLRALRSDSQEGPFRKRA